MNINWKELFPTKWSAIIFISYMLLFVNQGILVTASQTSNNKYQYNVVTVVLLTEVLKLLISTILYCKDHSFVSLLTDVAKNKNVLLLYFLPAFLYCLYNNLAFINLSTFDPTTYYLLLQLRVVITAILFQFFFKKHLTRKQWFSLFLLTAGCMLKQIEFHFNDNAIENETTKMVSSTERNLHKKNTTGLDLSISAVFILVQTVCSCLAGVYNEYILKGSGAEVNIFVQNVFMYLDSILCNGVILLAQGNLHEAFSTDSLQAVFHIKVIVIMINNATVGIITSFFLKSMNSILKTFASALELMFTAVFCYILFGIPIYLNTVLAILTVSYAVILYSQSPVTNVKVPVRTHEGETVEKEKLLEDV